MREYYKEVRREKKRRREDKENDMRDVMGRRDR